jgi:hypothetical protein
MGSRGVFAYSCLSSFIDLTAIGTQQVTPEQWYASLLGYLASSFQLNLNLRDWWLRGQPKVKS